MIILRFRVERERLLSIQMIDWSGVRMENDCLRGALE